MAHRYWVGGSGTWDDTSTANWATTSGGAAGASAPTSVDNATIDANSGTGSITCTGGAQQAVCQALTIGGSTISSIVGTVKPFGGVNKSGTTSVSALHIFTGGNLNITCNSALQTLTVVGNTSLLSSISIVSIGLLAAGALNWAPGLTQTVTNLTSTAGGSIYSSTVGTRATLTSTGTKTLTDIAAKDINFTVATWYKGSGFVDNGNNAGLTDLPMTSQLFALDL